MERAAGRAGRIALWAVVGIVAGVATSMAIILAGASVFWLFFFGDDPWPSPAETALVAGAYGAGGIVFLAIVLSQARVRR